MAGDGLDLQKMAGATLPSIDQEFSSADIEEISRSGGLWVAANQVKAGWLRAGIITGRAKLDLIDGRSVKLLWARSPLTFTLLKETLAEWVDGAVEVD